MAILPIRIFPDPALRQKAVPVEAITPAIKKNLDDMLETMYVNSGIGLAANQVGLTVRLVVIDISAREDEKGNPIEREPIKMINPEIIAKSEEKTVLDEGCLSLPETRCDVERPETVTARYRDENGKMQTIEASDLLSKAIQHEIDHLDGKLIFDYLSSLKRDIIIRRLKKMKNAE